MRDYLIHKLHSDVEGSCTGSFFIICVIDHEAITLGKIIPGRGDAEFTIHYKAIVYRPFRGETVDAVVTTVNKMGFFAEVGALNCFVSKQCIPADMPFDEGANPPSFGDGGDQVIARGAHVRMKLVGIRSDVGKMFATGSIKEVCCPFPLLSPVFGGFANRTAGLSWVPTPAPPQHTPHPPSPSPSPSPRPPSLYSKPNN